MLLFCLLREASCQSRFGRKVIWCIAEVLPFCSLREASCKSRFAGKVVGCVTEVLFVCFFREASCKSRSAGKVVGCTVIGQFLKLDSGAENGPQNGNKIVWRAATFRDGSAFIYEWCLVVVVVACCCGGGCWLVVVTTTNHEHYHSDLLFLLTKCVWKWTDSGSVELVAWIYIGC